MLGRLCYVLLGVSLISVTSLSQTLRGYGLKLGAVSATQSWDYHDTPYGIPSSLAAEPRWGIDAGAFVELLDNPYLSLLGEVRYSQKGFSVTAPISSPGNPEGIGTDTTLYPRVDYLSIPVLAKFRLETTSLTPYLITGPRVDIRLGQTDPVFEKFKRTEFGLSVGLGMEYPFQSVKGVLFEARYSPSLTKAYEGQYVDVKNSSFEFHLGVKL